MKPSHLAFAAAVVLLPVIYGCGATGWKASAVSVSSDSSAPFEPSAAREQERRFAGALEFLRSGREQDARDSLELVLAGPSRPGITDEAMFRLALLCLRDEAGRGTGRALELLERLKAEYPRSIWTSQGAPLTAYLTGVRSLRDRQREVKTLREQNLSLSRDNRELRQSIERLKSLDLELEQKIKR